MATIGNPLPPPRLIAHNQTPVFNKSQQQQQHNTSTEDQGVSSQHHSGLFMKEIPKLSRKIPSELNTSVISEDTKPEEELHNKNRLCDSNKTF